ncbi:MAG TPA: IPTL-CTERM sorting domain-containing protein [Thermodesulfobacteriota bacterium]|nr:IPTL-CTERM sorting domain-containing protein [Thermodesulfobacteriota bacterium]
MSRIRVSLSIAILSFGFAILTLPDDGLAGVMPIPISCCQQEGSCFDITDGPASCTDTGGIIMDNALCSEISGQCVGGGETSSIPALSEWGLMAAAVILGAAGYLAARRRKKAAA